MHIKIWGVWVRFDFKKTRLLYRGNVENDLIRNFLRDGCVRVKKFDSLKAIENELINEEPPVLKENQIEEA